MHKKNKRGKKTTKENINGLIGKLKNYQKDERREYAILEGKLPDSNRAKVEKCLDTLARIFCPSKKISEETCVALIKDENKLLIASNTEKAEYFHGYLEDFKTIVKVIGSIDSVSPPSNCDEEIKKAHERLLDKAFDKIYSFFPAGDTTFPADDIDDIDKTSEIDVFKNKVRDYKYKRISLEEAENEWRKAFFQISIENKTSYEKYWKYLLPVADTNNLIRYIVGNEEAINELILLIISKETKNTEFDSRDKKVHAEMKILGKLQNKEKRNEETYIGLSKLCCALCKLMIDIANGKGQKIKTCGAHGFIYSNWDIPRFYQNELLSELRSLDESKGKFNKICETTSVIPASYSSFGDIFASWLINKQENALRKRNINFSSIEELKKARSFDNDKGQSLTTSNLLNFQDKVIAEQKKVISLQDELISSTRKSHTKNQRYRIKEDLEKAKVGLINSQMNLESLQGQQAWVEVLPK